MKKKAIGIWLAAAWVVIALIMAGGATYAWFTFNPSTNVEPMSSTISDGEVALLIALHPNDEFGTQVALPKNAEGDLRPISTADLEHFYAASAQSRQGIVTTYVQADDRVETDTIHGTLYLKSLKDDCDVYFNRSGMDFGNDVQMLSAMRLGIRITIGNQTKSYIFALNDMADTQMAGKAQTTERENVVVNAISDQGNPTYVQDPARGLSAFFAVGGAQAGGLPKAGREALCTIHSNEIAMVEYWLYLEGCDENCVNEVQDREAGIQLSFAGVSGQQ